MYEASFIAINAMHSYSSLPYAECNFQVTPTEELLTLFMSHPNNGTIMYKTAKTVTSSRSATLVDALIKPKESDQAVNNSLCDISSLEVYRGRQQAFTIDESVFTMSESGALKVYCSSSHLGNKVMVGFRFLIPTG